MPTKQPSDYRETGTGMQMELVWSDDETMVTLYITKPRPGGGSSNATIRMSSLEADELRSFLNASIA